MNFNNIFRDVICQICHGLFEIWNWENFVTYKKCENYACRFHARFRFQGQKRKCIFFCFVGICFIFDNNISVNIFFVAENTIFFYFAQGAYLYSLLVTSRSIFTLDMVFSRCQFWKLPSQRGTIYRIVCLSQKHGYVISSVDRVKVL